MSNPKTESISLMDVIKYIGDGEYRIPRFQRNYVWKIDKVVDLIDSLLRGFPIGSVVLWQTKNELSEVKSFAGIQIPTRESGKYTSYIIDGQQRLTSLYFALKGLRTEQTPMVDCSNICISLTASDKEQLVYQELPSHANPNDFVYLKHLWDSTGLCGTHHEKRIFYYQLLVGYNIAAIKLDDERLGLEEVVDIFERINLKGKALNLFSIIAASSYIPDVFDLTSAYELLSKRISQYGSVKDTTLLQVIAACTIRKCNKSSILKELMDVNISLYYPKIEKALLIAIDHLKGSAYGVCVKAFLPYEAFLVPFTYFFYHQGNRQLTLNQQKYLLDYFWRSNVTNRYGSSTDTTINADLLKMDAILKDEIPVQEPVSLSPCDIIQKGNTSLKSAFSKSMLCLMYTNSPRSFAPGRDIFVDNNPQSNSAENQLHHFFPQRSKVILGSQEYKNMVNCVVNVIFMDALTNQQIGNKNPSDYIGEYVSNNEKFDDLLRSHYINLVGFGIENNDFDTFLKARSEALYAALVARLVRRSGDNLKEISSITDASILSNGYSNSDIENIDNESAIFKVFAKGKGVKNDVVKYLRDKGVYLSNAITYATFQSEKNAYWANPHPNMLSKEWTIVLNNHHARRITILVVPANTFAIHSIEGQGLFIRADDPKRIDLNLRVSTLCDRKSNLDFAPYVEYILDYGQE
jgi:hypothetical protein